MTELLDHYYKGEPKDAANTLAFLAKHAATWLENLSVKRPELIREVAKSFDTWPVNLGVRRAKSGNQELTRREFARAYLTQLCVNSDCRWPSTVYSGAEEKSPFRIAAQELHLHLLMIKDNPRANFLKRGRLGWFVKLTPWAKRLIALPEPMTITNVDAWWKVAKVWLDETWEINRDEAFGPLIKHLKHFRNGITNITPSLVQKQVIDDSLKKAFKALAVHFEQ